jgi:hypothetical protein
MSTSDTIRIVKQKSEAPFLNRNAGRITFRLGQPSRHEDLCKFLVSRGVKAEVDLSDPADPAVKLVGITDLHQVESLVSEWAEQTA